MEKQVDLAIMKKKLKKQQNVLSSRLEVEREKAEPGSVANPDRADLAHEYAYRAGRLSMVEQLEEQLEDVDQALQRIEDGTYGECNNCGKSITPERLEALPSAELCIDCQRQKTTG
jgi:RNA polymerase-binding protein DksA